jgi:signal transduction histidine kinase
LFLIHPVRLVPRWLCKLVFAVLLLWAVASFFRLHPSSRVLMQFPILLEMTIIIVAATAQAFASRKNPQDRSAMRWFGLSVIIGAGSFVFLSIAPPVFGIEPVVSQGHAFALFTLIYAGVAIGVARYRLFQIEEWAFRILFYVGGVVLLLGIDVALIYFVALDRVPAFSIALIVVTFAYLPARHAIGRVLGRGKNLTQENMFDLVSDVGLAASAEDQRRSFHKLMEAVFDPIKINDIDDAIDPHPPLLQSRIGQGGEILDVPGFDRVPPFRLRWARQGRRLFGPNDERRANALLAMLRQMLDRREAYEAGAQEERQRINRDIHDNIGIQLLGALHTQVPVRKDSLIRQALTDLREIVSNNDGDTPVLDHLLADLRNEISEHLLAADILVDWPLGEASNLELTAQSAITIRAILREAAGNIIRHSGATQVWIKTQVTYQDETQPPFFHLAVRDNGSKTNPESPLALSYREGRGLANLKLRAAIMGGKLVFGQMPDGTGSILEAEFQLRPAIKGQEYAPDIYETEQKGLVHNTR